MIWRSLKDYPTHQGRVLLVDGWGEMFSGYCWESNGSRYWHSDAQYIDSDKTHRFRWTDTVKPPTDQEWEATSENR